MINLGTRNIQSFEECMHGGRKNKTTLSMREENDPSQHFFIQKRSFDDFSVIFYRNVQMMKNDDCVLVLTVTSHLMLFCNINIER